MKAIKYNMDDVRFASCQELFKVVSLFAGGGGSSTGYRLAGAKVLGINEFIPAAQDAYHVNYPDTVIFKQDVRKLTGAEIMAALGLKQGELDVLDGSPPCASFSTAGLREKGWGREKKYSDSKQRTDDLFFEFARILKELQPRAFICENVKGITIGAAKYMLGSSQIDLFAEENETDTIYGALTEAGYQIRVKVLNAKNFGVPQSRDRAIIIGVRNDIKKPISFPVDRLEPVSVGEAFKDLLFTEKDQRETDIRKYAIYPQSLLLKAGEQSEKYFSLVKLDPEKPSPTFTATAGSIGAASVIHWNDRKVSVAEAIRICGFPDDYYLGEKYQEKIERLGRAVPPLMMKGVAEWVYETILR
jgi:DNA (cytosine-5)-methyltransferase 1